MNASTGTLICPRGHLSAEPDYCSECGAKIQGPTRDNIPVPNGQLASAETCPDCGTVREQKDVAFCEVCGYNFTTGAHGEVPVTTAPAEVAPLAPPAPPEPDPEPEPTPEPVFSAIVRAWMVSVSVDPALRGAESPEPPSDFDGFSVALRSPGSLIGRRNEARGILPEIALDHDEAVSRRHALLQLDADGALKLRDIGAANGTRLNGQDLQPMIDYPVKDGDEITLGHWSRIKIHASQDSISA